MHAELCKSASSRKPYPLQGVPPVALVESNGTHRHRRVTPSLLPWQVERRAQRAQARLQRAALSAGQRRRASERISRILAASPLLRGRRRIALYIAIGAEPDTQVLLAFARRRGLKICLPRIRNYPRHTMDFIADSGMRRRLNRHGIPEPPPGARIPIESLDVIVLPTLAFNRSGMRLGTGGGYYDRILERLPHLPVHRRPRLVGMAYACSEMPALVAAAHDIRLDQIVTDAELIDCHPLESP